MIIKINLTKKEIEHLKNCNSHSDACQFVYNIIIKIHNEIYKRRLK